MSLESRIKKIEEKLKEFGTKYTYKDHPHVASAHMIKGKFYNDDGTEFIANHLKDCPQLFIVRHRGEEFHEMPV